MAGYIYSRLSFQKLCGLSNIFKLVLLFLINCKRKTKKANNIIDRKMTKMEKTDTQDKM